MTIDFNDITRAFFQADAIREMHVELPSEDSQPGMRGKLENSMYGMGGAAQDWGCTCTEFMLDTGAQEGHSYLPRLDGTYHVQMVHIPSRVFKDQFGTFGVFIFEVSQRLELKSQIPRSLFSLKNLRKETVYIPIWLCASHAKCYPNKCDFRMHAPDWLYVYIHMYIYICTHFRTNACVLLNLRHLHRESVIYMHVCRNE